MDADGWKLVDEYMDFSSHENRNKLENKLQERDWKIEGFRYISPDENFSDSHIHEVCVYLKKEAEAEEDPSVQREEVPEREEVLLLEGGPEREDLQRKRKRKSKQVIIPENLPEAVEEYIILVKKGRALAKKAKQHLLYLGWKIEDKRKLKQVIIPENLPEALEEYIILVKKRRALAKKAKQHLLYLGWKIEDTLTSKGRFEERYISPQKNRGYGSLLSACKRATKANEAHQQQQQQQPPPQRVSENLFHSIGPDGTKKAYVRLTPDYDALDVANKIGII